MTKVMITALRPFSHGNVDAYEGRAYEMNKGDAHELEKLGFLSFGGIGEAEQTQVETPPQKHNAGDVVTDPTVEDLLGGDAKAAPPLKNKMASTIKTKE